MPRPRHQLDLLWLPRDPDAAAPAPQSVHLALEEAGWRAPGLPRGRAGPQVAELVEGGCAALRLEVLERVGIWANQQGGYRVYCPTSGNLLSQPFMAAVTRWRDGGARRLHCGACGQEHALEALDFQPPAGFSRWALVLRDVASAAPAEGARQRVEAVLGHPLHWLVRRAW